MQRFSILLVLLASGAVAALAQSPDKCGDLAKFQMPGTKIEITRAELVAAGPAAGGRAGQTGPMLPAHCRVNGIVDRRTGPDGKTYGIRFAIALPANWTGQFLQQGGGGLNGTVAEPTGAQAAGDRPPLARGFAVATSDTGHQSAGGAFDRSRLRNRSLLLGERSPAAAVRCAPIRRMPSTKGKGAWKTPRTSPAGNRASGCFAGDQATAPADLDRYQDAVLSSITMATGGAPQPNLDTAAIRFSGLRDSPI